MMPPMRAALLRIGLVSVLVVIGLAGCLPPSVAGTLAPT